MKSRHIFNSVGVFAVHTLIISGIALITGCQDPLVLSNRDEVPAPAPSPEIAPQPEEDITPIAIAPPTAVAPIAPMQEIPPMTPVEIKTVSYTVKKGDSFWRIAHSYGVSARELAAFNGLAYEKPLKVGTVLQIPPGGSNAPLPPKAASPSVKKSEMGSHQRKPMPSDGTYVVKSGDSLWKIAVSYNLKTSTLAAANNLDIKKPLRVGQKLVIPGGAGNKSTHRPRVTKKKKPTPPRPKKTKPVDKPKKVEKAPAPMDEILPDEPKDEVLPTTGNKIDKDALDALENDTPPDVEDILKEIDKAEGANDLLDDAAPAAKAGAKVKRSANAHQVLQDMTLKEFADQYGFKESELKAVNPDLPANGKLKKGMLVYFPE